MWRAISAFVMLDAGREIRHRVGTLAFYGVAGGIALVAVLFALQAAQLYLAQMMPAPMASLSVSAGLIGLAALVLLAAWLRQRRNRTSLEIRSAMLATVPLAKAVVQRFNPSMLMALAVLAGAAMIGKRLRRKD